MTGRRQFLSFVGASLVLTPLVAWLSRSQLLSRDANANVRFPVERSDAEWRAALGPERYRILRERGTEWAHSSPLDKEKRSGVFGCAGCGQPLFSSSTKFESGTGWPSFYAPLDGAVATSIDRDFFMVRTEVHCARCGGHLGHVFPDGPPPTGQRYCMNGVAMTFEPIASPA
ncbi:MAG: peptide-methionine (R)-S-oxide reductase MsrB [Acidobacteria bacterium]|nr:peptide-methionine (R)-S-oxide reductase MsrB [Acidobacteriota bacterium]